MTLEARKMIHWYAGNTATAARLGFPAGCHAVEVQHPGQPLVIVQAHANAEDARAHFDKLPQLPCPVFAKLNLASERRKGPAWLND